MAPPTALKLSLFATGDATWRHARDRYVAVANELLGPHGMVLDLYPADPGCPPIPLTPQGKMSTAEAYLRVRGLAHQALPDGNGRIPVIFACLGGSNAVTVRPGGGGSTWLPFILINADNHSWHEETLVHELVHAGDDYEGTDPEDPSHDAEGNSVMAPRDPITFEGPVQHRSLTGEHATALRNAYFAGPNTRKLG